MTIKERGHLFWITEAADSTGKKKFSFLTRDLDLDAYREAFSECLGIIVGNLYYCNNNLQVAEAEAAEGEERYLIRGPHNNFSSFIIEEVVSSLSFAIFRNILVLFILNDF